MIKTMREKELDPNENAAVVKLLREIRDRDFDGLANKLADKLKLSSGLISEIFSGTRQPGLRVLKRLRALTGKSIDEILWPDEKPPTRLVELDPGTGHVRLGDVSGFKESQEQVRMMFKRFPELAHQKTADLMTRDPPEMVTPEIYFAYIQAVFSTLSDEQRTEAYTADARAAAERSDQIRADLRAKGLSPEANPLEWNIEFQKAKAKAEGLPFDEAKLDAIKSPPPGPVKARVNKRENPHLFSD